ncbi:uncharacterized protein SCHCODRAFT_02065510 [Schizophyllum commune H4-8]|uniref:uncharacterized protein n=1 Tax=Schizophyllum commune (strain H4-8 / FGSC 9210) TaxID=578458 RepID=UPI00215E2B80|nr:uncharacterized protein SCHCODRAFT_02065510 [Schizophyllum commune H4-8]KAI5887427.1 hypothetical protein SCHCODRAFT_02065510 [Schizophyllum commune H4-8]
MVDGVGAFQVRRAHPLHLIVMLTAVGSCARVDFALAKHSRRLPLFVSPARQRIVTRWPYRAAPLLADAASPSGWARCSVLRPAQFEGERMSIYRGVSWDVDGRIQPACLHRNMLGLSRCGVRADAGADAGGRRLSWISGGLCGRTTGCPLFRAPSMVRDGSRRERKSDGDVAPGGFWMSMLWSSARLCRCVVERFS